MTINELLLSSMVKLLAFDVTGACGSKYPAVYVRQNGNLYDSIFPVLVDGATEGIIKDTGLFSNTPNYLYKKFWEPERAYSTVPVLPVRIELH